MKPSKAQKNWVIGGILLAVFLAFGQTLGHDFINLDDDVYVYENPQVSSGLTWHGIGWAFTHVHTDNWHPLTWISHMIDCQKNRQNNHKEVHRGHAEEKQNVFFWRPGHVRKPL